MFDTFIVNPMTNALLLLYGLLGNNFIVAIAVLTILIRLVTLPLSLKQQRASLRMQEMQPQIQGIQKKYKDNPAKMQEEFKKIGYNPTESLMGCLPLLIQFPVLIGLYQAIIALLGSTPPALFNLTGIIYPWVNDIINVGSSLPIPNKFLWLNLAQPDPFYVMPILIFVTMFASQKLMTPPKPKATDDKKAKQEDNPMAGMTQSMQYTMPIMFAFFSLSFPSGLSIYWIMSNVIGVAQSYLTRYSMAKEKAKNELAGEQIPATTGIPESPAAAAATNGREANVRTLQKSKQATSKRKKKRARR